MALKIGAGKRYGQSLTKSVMYLKYLSPSWAEATRMKPIYLEPILCRLHVTSQSAWIALCYC